MDEERVKKMKKKRRRGKGRGRRRREEGDLAVHWATKLKSVRSSALCWAGADVDTAA